MNSNHLSEPTAGGARGAFRTVIADDEPLARARLRRLLSPHVDFVVVAECENGPQFVDAVICHEPDLALVDIEMPVLDGIASCGHLGARVKPLLVFVTAHPRFALQGFDLHAFDYLLKPVAPARFADTMARARVALTARPAGIGATAREKPCTAWPERLVLKHDGGFHLVVVADILWVRADSDFIKVHTVTGTHLVRQSLTSFAVTLDPARFLRIHRSHLVPLNRVRKFFLLERGDYAVELTEGTVLRISRPFLEHVRSVLLDSLEGLPKKRA